MQATLIFYGSKENPQGGKLSLRYEGILFSVWLTANQTSLLITYAEALKNDKHRVHDFMVGFRNSTAVINETNLRLTSKWDMDENKISDLTRELLDKINAEAKKAIGEINVAPFPGFFVELEGWGWKLSAFPSMSAS